MKKFYSALIVLYPILSRYAAPVPVISLAEFLLICFALLSFMSKDQKYGLVKDVLPLICYLIFSIFGAYYTVQENLRSDAIGSLVRLLFLYLFFTFFSDRYFQVQWAEMLLINSSLLVAGYGLIQTIASFSGRVLTTYLPLLPIFGESNIDEEVRKNMAYGLPFRCRSVLNEPAALCCYLILPIAICLFSACKVSEEKKLKIKALFLTFVTVLSMSSTGIIMVIFIWSVYYLRKSKSKKELFRRVMMIPLAVVVGSMFLYLSGIGEYFVDRTFKGTISLANLTNSSRFYAIQEMFGASNSLGGVLFGQGLAELTEYLPGWPRLYLCLGLCGLVAMIWMLVRLYGKGNEKAKKIVIFFATLNIGTEIILGPFALYYLTFIRANRKMECSEKTMAHSLSKGSNIRKGE